MGDYTTVKDITSLLKDAWIIMLELLHNRQKMQHHFWFVLCTIVEDVTSFLNHALGDYAIVKVIAPLLNYVLV